MFLFYTRFDKHLDNSLTFILISGEPAALIFVRFLLQDKDMHFLTERYNNYFPFSFQNNSNLSKISP